MMQMSSRALLSCYSFRTRTRRTDAARETGQCAETALTFSFQYTNASGAQALIGATDHPWRCRPEGASSPFQAGMAFSGP